MIYSEAKKPKVSVVIPTFNSAVYLRDSIDSALNQTFSALEIIVVNDGSTDCTEDVLKEYHDDVIYLSQKNRGPSSARNLAMRHAKGEYIAFLDADDLWLPEKIEKQMELFRETSSATLVYSRFSNFDHESGNGMAILPEKVYSGALFDKLLVTDLILLSTVVVRSSILFDIGGFDENLFTARRHKSLSKNSQNA